MHTACGVIYGQRCKKRDGILAFVVNQTGTSRGAAGTAHGRRELRVDFNHGDDHIFRMIHQKDMVSTS